MVTRRSGLCFTEKVPSGKHRVWPGGLAITRSFGDYHAKLTAFGGVPDSVLYEFEEMRVLDMEQRWMGLILASDGVWDALPADACWKTFSDATGESPELEEEDKMMDGVTSMINACCDSPYWLNNGYNADNTTAIVLSFHRHFDPEQETCSSESSSGSGRSVKGGARAGAAGMQEETKDASVGESTKGGRGSSKADLGLVDFKKLIRKQVSFAED